MTQTLMNNRRKAILAKIEERIKTSVERERFAKEKLRQELVAMGEKGAVKEIKEMLLMISEEAEKSNSRPRFDDCVILSICSDKKLIIQFVNSRM